MESSEDSSGPQSTIRMRQSPLPSPAVSTQVEPPPLPQQIKRLQIACWIGLVLGGLWGPFSGLAFVGTLLMPIAGSPPSILLALTSMAALSQTFCAWSLRRGHSGALLLFCISSVGLAFFLLLIGGFLFALLNLVPLALMWWSAKPGLERAEAFEGVKDDPVTADFSDVRSTATERKEDIY